MVPLAIFSLCDYSTEIKYHAGCSGHEVAPEDKKGDPL